MVKQEVQKNTSKKSKFILKLQIGENTVKTYRITEKLFIEIENLVSPFRSFSLRAKPIKCVETGEIFSSAKQAANSLIINNLTKSYSADAAIKEVCKGKRKTAYGYHWEFIIKQK